MTILRRHLPYLEPDQDAVPDAPLRSLGLDSLKAVALILDLEDELDITLPDSSLSAGTFETAGTLWAAVYQGMSGGESRKSSISAATRSGSSNSA